MMTAKSHNNFIAIAKGIGIILMVLGHCGVPGIIGRFIYQFHMPLFFFCSGYFFKDIIDKYSLLAFYKKRIKSIYIKFLCWSILFLMLHNIFFHLNIYNEVILFHGKSSYLYNTQDYFHKAIRIIFSMNEHEQLLRSFWFLKQLFLSSLLVSSIVYLANKVIHNKHTSSLILLVLFSITIIAKIYEWSIPAIWDISLVFMSATFYYSGYYFHKYNILNKINNNFIHLALLFISLIGLSILPWTNMLEYTSITVIPFFTVAYAGIILTLKFSAKLEKKETKSIFYYLGNNTMVIFALHMLSFKIGNLIKIVIYNMPLYRLAEFQIIYEHNDYFWIIYTIIGISLPLFIDYLMKLTDKTKKIWRFFI